MRILVLAVPGLLLSQAAPAQAQPEPAAPPAAAPAAPPPAAPPAAAPPTATAAPTERPPLVPPPTAVDPAKPADPARPDPSKPAPRPHTSDGIQGALSQRSTEVFSEEWWTHTRPVLEIHGLYRLRAELFQNFALGRTDSSPDSGLWAPPIDYRYLTPGGNRSVGPGVDGSNGTTEFDNCNSSTTEIKNCRNKTQSGANMRFRLNPELHISDNLRILSQVDLLDNLVLGSTPDSYYNTTSSKTGATVVGARSPYAPLSFFSNTTEPPTAGRNSLTNSIAVKRVWGDYMTPVGVLLRFGRQPNHWGLGMLHNSGDGHDSDWQSTIDRIMFATTIKSLDLHVAGMWDFPSEGAIGTRVYEMQGQPYDLGQLDDVSQYGLMVMRRRNPDLARQDLAEGKVVINGGLYALYRNQIISNDASGNSSTNATLGQSTTGVQSGLVRRNAWSITPDAWGQVRYRKFRFEFEFASTQGAIENTQTNGTDYNSGQQAGASSSDWKIRQYMLVTQTEFRAIEDRLRVQFGFGWTSGDPGILGADALSPKGTGLPSQGPLDRTFSMGRFHPDYRVDLILFRNILSRVQGAYYFKPQVDYDFARNLNGQKFGGGASIIWSRASEFIQAPGHKRDLGVELDFQLYYQSKDGSLNDDPDRMGGFYTSLQYGVLFPLGGLGYQSGETTQAQNNGVVLDTGAAHILRWYTGIMF